jgi:hypothetical protein
MADLSDRLRRLIAMQGPIPLALYMAEANAHYYSTRDPLGAGGDFITAPEISQMFGEMVGVWLADVAAGRAPARVIYAEPGPGRGTLARDALRVAARFGLVPDVHFIEGSPELRRAQAQAFPQAVWHEDLSTLPEDAPILLVANDFSMPCRCGNGQDANGVARADGRAGRGSVRAGVGRIADGQSHPQGMAGGRCGRDRRNMPGGQCDNGRNRRKAGRAGRGGADHRLWLCAKADGIDASGIARASACRSVRNAG